MSLNFTVFFIKKEWKRRKTKEDEGNKIENKVEIDTKSMTFLAILILLEDESNSDQTFYLFFKKLL